MAGPYVGVSAKDAGPQPECPCHGVPMFWNRDPRTPAGGYSICAVTNRAKTLVTALADVRSGRRVERYADQLSRGERILHEGSHHEGMAVLKTRLADSRPDGLTLSLVNWDSPDAYDGYAYNRRGERISYRLSTNPADYIWETIADNHARDAARRASEVAIA